MASSSFEERLLGILEEDATFVITRQPLILYHGVGRWLLFVFAPEKTALALVPG
jgi:hypothetical protein